MTPLGLYSAQVVGAKHPIMFASHHVVAHATSPPGARSTIFKLTARGCDDKLVLKHAKAFADRRSPHAEKPRQHFKGQWKAIAIHFEHFPHKWEPVARKKMRLNKGLERPT